MNIYITTMFNSQWQARTFATELEKEGHTVKLSFGRGASQEFLKQHTTPELIATNECKDARAEEEMNIEWADVVIMFQPSGRVSHMVGGYVKGKGKPLFLCGSHTKGECEFFYAIADGVFGEDAAATAEALKTIRPEQRGKGWIPVQKFVSVETGKIYHFFDGSVISLCGRIGLEEIPKTFEARGLNQENNCPVCVKILKETKQ